MDDSNILVFGLGLSGSSVARFIISHSLCKNLYLTDANDSTAKLLVEDLKHINTTTTVTTLNNPQQHDLTTNKITLIIISPGIPSYADYAHPLVKNAKHLNISIITDLEFFYNIKYLKNPETKFFGITGSNGKSTTSSLLSWILNGFNIQNSCVGNIGLSPFADSAYISPNFVIEISSYQLENTNIPFDGAILLNLSPNHLERYGYLQIGEAASMQNYINTKAKITANPKGAKAIGLNDQFSRKLYSRLRSNTTHRPLGLMGFKTIGYEENDPSQNFILSEGITYHNNQIFLDQQHILTLPTFPNLKGIHNIQNIVSLITLLIASYEINTLNINLLDPTIFTKFCTLISTFKGLEHRMEYITTFHTSAHNINFYNDSKSTTHTATLTAIRSFDNIYLICGGKQKELGIESIITSTHFHKVKKIFLFGEATQNFANTLLQHNKILNHDFYIHNTLQEATQQAFSLAHIQSFSDDHILKHTAATQQTHSHQSDINILLSPMCASFDQFKNFEQRGQAFKNTVTNITNSPII